MYTAADITPEKVVVAAAAVLTPLAQSLWLAAIAAVLVAVGLIVIGVRRRRRDRRAAGLHRDEDGQK